jgi:outer membrane protein OmpA-like peptidoglycan-associated protein
MKKFIFLLVVSLMFLSSGNSNAQINNILRSVKNKSVNKVNQNIDQGLDKGLDATEKDVKEGANKETKAGAEEDQKTEQAEQAVQVEEQKEEVDKESGDTKAKEQEAPSLQVYSKYDFIPGQKVIFYEDFTQDAVGDFPALWNTNGSAEVVTTNLFPGNWLRFIGRDAVWTDGLLTLPDNYTVEFDIVPIKGEENNMTGYSVRLLQSKNPKSYDAGGVPGDAGFHYEVEYFGRPSYKSYINLDGGENLGLTGYKEGDNYKQLVDQKYHIAIWVQKARVRLYQNENKLFDLPKAFNLEGVKMDRLRFEDGSLMVTNIRIAVGAPDTRNKLLTEGKLVTYGIYFDVNKDVVKPESYGTLKDIAAVLNENPAGKVKIVGFTDSDGNDAANLDLSKRRAAAVKAELAKSFNVDGSRIETDGMGEGQPVAPNDSPSNKALNRRVEFLKM